MDEDRDTIRALHVDDDPQFAEVATAFLEREDDRFDTETATSVSEGLTRLLERDFDCIVSDHDMPGRDGIEFLEAVREDHPALPFILYTGKGSEEVASDAISKGATDYLQKGSGTEQYELLANRVRNAVEQYRSTQRAKQTCRRLRRLAESTTDCVWMFDRDWDELLFISGYRAVWDRPVDAIRNDPQDFLDGVHPDDRSLVRDAMERMSNGESIDIEYRILRGDGGSGWVWVQGEPVFDDDGTVGSVVGFTQDITDRKRREQELELIETLFEHAEECQFIVDVAGGEFELRHANRYYRRTVGLSSADPVTGQTPTELFGERRGRAILERYRACVETREPVTYTAELLVSGASATYRTILTPVVDEDEVTHVVGTARDVTERERQTEQLVSLNERSQMLMTADTSEEIAEIGVEAARETLGLAASSIHLYDTEQSALVPVAATAALRDLIGDPPVFTGGDSIAWRAYERGEAQAIDDVRDDPDVYSPETPMRSELYFPLDDHGILLAGSSTPGSFGEQDITLGEILAANISSALEQVTKSERLRTREERLTRQNRRLEEFTSVVSHDLQSPLSVAEGRLQFAREECDSDQLAHVGRALRRMNTLIEDVLTMAREGEIVTDLDPVDLATMAEHCWANVETADATLVVDTDQTVYADRTRLRQVFENLVRNAVEHGGGDVTVVFGGLDGGFYVEDDGPGIPPGEREDVFETGYSTTEEGTGFGLSIVEQVVEAHGWSARATEGSDGGARIEVTGVELTGCRDECHGA